MVWRVAAASGSVVRSPQSSKKLDSAALAPSVLDSLNRFWMEVRPLYMAVQRSRTEIWETYWDSVRAS